MSTSEAKNSSTGLTALSTTQANGYAISALSFYNQFSVCTSTAYCATLSLSPYLAPQVYEVRNDGVSTLSLFPGVGGSINGLAANAAIMIPSGSSVKLKAILTAAGLVQWYAESLIAPMIISANMTAHAGGTRLLANAIPANQFMTIIGTCASILDSISLPITPVLGQKYTVINSGAAPCAIYAGLHATLSLIDAIPSDNTDTCYFPLMYGARCDFVAYSNAAGLVQWYSSGLVGPTLVIPVAAARVLLAQEQGAIIKMTKASAFAITLPTATTVPGAKFTVIQTAASAAFTVNVTGGASSLVGSWINTVAGSLTGATTAGTASANLNFLTGASVLGDHAEFISDGARYQVKGIGGAAACFSFS
jgi:hypothetical protein